MDEGELQTIEAFLDAEKAIPPHVIKKLVVCIRELQDRRTLTGEQLHKIFTEAWFRGEEIHWWGVPKDSKENWEATAKGITDFLR